MSVPFVGFPKNVALFSHIAETFWWVLGVWLSAQDCQKTFEMCGSFVCDQQNKLYGTEIMLRLTESEICRSSGPIFHPRLFSPSNFITSKHLQQSLAMIFIKCLNIASVARCLLTYSSRRQDPTKFSCVKNPQALIITASSLLSTRLNCPETQLSKLHSCLLNAVRAIEQAL
jgi:hypothetical protein